MELALFVFMKNEAAGGSMLEKGNKVGEKSISCYVNIENIIFQKNINSCYYRSIIIGPFADIIVCID